MPSLKQKVCFGVPKRRGISITVLLLIAIIWIAPLIGTRTTVYKLALDRFKIRMRGRFLTVRLLQL